MTVKKHTPSGAENSTSARTTKQPAEPVRPKSKGRGSKATAKQLRERDELTAARIQSILSDPNTPSSVAGRLQTLVGDFYGAIDADTLPDTPEVFAAEFESADAALEYDAEKGAPVEKARAARAKLAAFAERHEPKAFKVARRCSEIYAEWLTRKNADGHHDGAYYFATHVDAVLEGGADGLIPNPDSKHFPPIFAEAFDGLGPRDRRVRKLLDLIKRVDAGADLNGLHDEDERASREREQAHRPKDALLVDALSEVLRDPKNESEREAVLDSINNLSNEIPGFNDLYPEVFPTLAAVLIREGRKYVAQARVKFPVSQKFVRDALRQLEEVAREKGGAR